MTHKKLYESVRWHIKKWQQQKLCRPHHWYMAHSIHLLHADISAIVPRPRCKLHQHARLTWLTGYRIHPVCGFTTHSKYYESDVRLCVRSKELPFATFHNTSVWLRGIPHEAPKAVCYVILREGAPQHHQGIKNISWSISSALTIYHYLYTMITNFIIYCCYIWLQSTVWPIVYMLYTMDGWLRWMDDDDVDFLTNVAVASHCQVGKSKD